MMYLANGVLPENLRKTDKILADMVIDTAKEIEEATSGDYAQLTEYLADVLDVENKVGGVEILLTYGGPTISFDTSTGTIKGNWHSENGFYMKLNDSTCEAVENYFEPCR